MKKIIKHIILMLALSLAITACSQQPVEIHYGSDECAHCRMMITDNHFASQIITKKGKAIKFDAIECLAAYQKENREELGDAVFWISDYENPGEWLKAENAIIIKSEVIKSPMGASLLAVSSVEIADKHIQE